MKHVITILAFVALINFSVVPYTMGGEVKRQPLQMEEMVELKKQEAQDFDVIEHTDAGIKNGYGLLTVALAVAVGYIVAQQIDDEDDE